MEGLLKTFDLTVIDGYMILVVAALFVLLWRTLEKVLFKPYLRLIEAREKATVGVEQEAEEAYQKAQVGEREYEAKITEARKVAMEKKLAEVAKAKAEADKILAAATSEAEKIMTAARAEIKRDAEEARKTVLAQADILAGELVAKLKQPPAIARGSLN